MTSPCRLEMFCSLSSGTCLLMNMLDTAVRLSEVRIPEINAASVARVFEFPV